MIDTEKVNRKQT